MYGILKWMSIIFAVDDIKGFKSIPIKQYPTDFPIQMDANGCKWMQMNVDIIFAVDDIKGFKSPPESNIIFAVTPWCRCCLRCEFVSRRDT